MPSIALCRLFASMLFSNLGSVVRSRIPRFHLPRPMSDSENGTIDYPEESSTDSDSHSESDRPAQRRRLWFSGFETYDSNDAGYQGKGSHEDGSDSTCSDAESSESTSMTPTRSLSLVLVPNQSIDLLIQRTSSA